MQPTSLLRIVRPFPTTAAAAFLVLTLCLATKAFAFSMEKGPFYGDLTGYLEGNFTIPLHRDTPPEDPSGRLKLEGTGDLGESLRFKLITRMTYDGTVRPPKDWNPLQEFDQVYQGKPFLIEFQDAYMQVTRDTWDLTVGIKRVTWGVLDERSVVDNINPQDYSRFLLESLAERKIGVPMVKLDWYPRWVSGLRLEAVWVPVYVPYRLARPGERWFPPVLLVPNSIDTGIEGLPPVNLIANYAEIGLPPRTLKNSEVGFRVSRSFSGFDLAVSYFHGFDSNTPAFRGEGVLEVSLINQPPFVAADYFVNVVPDPARIHVWGLEATKVVGPVTLRGEWAFVKGGRYTLNILEGDIEDIIQIPDLEELALQVLANWAATGVPSTSVRLDPLLSLKKDVMRGGIGVDYLYGDHLFTAQLLADYILDHDPRLLSREVEVFASVSLRFSFMDASLEPELALMYNFTRSTVLLRPEVSYKFLPDLKVTARLVFVEGPRDSLVGQYKDNDQIQFLFRYSF